MEELRACFVHAGLSHQGGCAWGAWGQAGRGPRFGKLIHPPCPGKGACHLPVAGQDRGPGEAVARAQPGEAGGPGFSLGAESRTSCHLTIRK